MPTDVADTAAELARLAPMAMTRPAEVLQALAGLQPADAAQHALRLRVRGLARVYMGQPEGLAELVEAHGALADAAPRLRFDAERALSMGHAQLGLLDEALAWGHRALETARASGDEGARAEGLLSCGVALSRAGQGERALTLYEQALALFLAQGQWRSAVSALNNLGINHKNLGRPAQALAHYERALTLCAAQGLDDVLPVLRSNLPEPLAQLGRLSEARALGKAVVAEMRERAHLPGEMSAQIGLARVLQELGEPAPARSALQRAVELARLSGDRVQAARAHQQLAGLHKAAGDWRAACEHLEAAHEAERTQHREDSERRLQALQVQTELSLAREDASRERSLRLALERAQGELVALNAQLQATDRDKSRLLARLAHESRTDALTELPNRRAFDERLTETWQSLRRRADRPLTLALLDVDHFKAINDRFGHPTGDAVLRQLAALLRAHARAGDFAARVGGEEFVLLLPDTDASAAATAAEHWRAVVAAHDWSSLHAALQVRVSIGLAEAREALDAAALLAQADARLYAAKQAGRNRVVGPQSTP